MKLKALILASGLLATIGSTYGMHGDARNKGSQRSRSAQDLNSYGRHQKGIPTRPRGSYRNNNQTEVRRRQPKNQISTDESPFDYLYGVANNQNKTIEEQCAHIEHLEQRLELSEKLLGTLQDTVSKQKKQIATLSALCGRLCEATGIQDPPLAEKDIPITTLFPFLSSKEMETWKNQE